MFRTSMSTCDTMVFRLTDGGSLGHVNAKYKVWVNARIIETPNRVYPSGRLQVLVFQHYTTFPVSTGVTGDPRVGNTAVSSVTCLPQKQSLLCLDVQNTQSTSASTQAAQHSAERAPHPLLFPPSLAHSAPSYL